MDPGFVKGIVIPVFPCQLLHVNQIIIILFNSPINSCPKNRPGEPVGTSARETHIFLDKSLPNQYAFICSQ